MRKDKEAWGIGPYTLTRRADQTNGIWHRTEQVDGKTKRTSLRTNDFEQAKIILAEFFLSEGRENFDEEPSEHILMTEVIDNYLENYCLERDKENQRYYIDTGLPKVSDQSRNVLHHRSQFVEYFGENATLNEYTEAAQSAFIQYQLTNKRKKKSSVDRIMTTARSAVNYCYSKKVLAEAIPILRVKHRLNSRVRTLSAMEFAALLESVDSPHLFNFLVLAIATAGRPGAIVELSRFSIDGSTINLLPAGREQVANKFRPILPICETLSAFIPHMPMSGPFVQLRGQPVQSVKGSFAAARKRADLSEDVVRYTARHTVSSFMARRGVEIEHIDMWLGHSGTDYKMTRHYIHSHPSWLMRAKSAVDSFFLEICECFSSNTTEFCDLLRSIYDPKTLKSDPSATKLKLVR